MHKRPKFEDSVESEEDKKAKKKQKWLNTSIYDWNDDAEKRRKELDEIFKWENEKILAREKWIEEHKHIEGALELLPSTEGFPHKIYQGKRVMMTCYEVCTLLNERYEAAMENLQAELPQTLNYFLNKYPSATIEAMMNGSCPDEDNELVQYLNKFSYQFSLERILDENK
jgi:hypothetical protein